MATHEEIIKAGEYRRLMEIVQRGRSFSTSYAEIKACMRTVADCGHAEAASFMINDAMNKNIRSLLISSSRATFYTRSLSINFDSNRFHFRARRY